MSDLNDDKIRAVAKKLASVVVKSIPNFCFVEDLMPATEAEAMNVTAGVLSALREELKGTEDTIQYCIEAGVSPITLFEDPKNNTPN